MTVLIMCVLQRETVEHTWIKISHRERGVFTTSRISRFPEITLLGILICYATLYNYRKVVRIKDTAELDTSTIDTTQHKFESWILCLL